MLWYTLHALHDGTTKNSPFNITCKMNSKIVSCDMWTLVFDVYDAASILISSYLIDVDRTCWNVCSLFVQVWTFTNRSFAYSVAAATTSNTPERIILVLGWILDQQCWPRLCLVFWEEYTILYQRRPIYYSMDLQFIDSKRVKFIIFNVAMLRVSYKCTKGKLCTVWVILLSNLKNSIPILIFSVIEAQNDTPLVILLFRLPITQESSEISTIFLSVWCNLCKTVICFRWWVICVN